MSEHVKCGTLSALAEEQVPAAFDLWPTIAARLEEPRRRTRRLRTAVAAAAVLCAVAAAGIVLWGQTETVSAEAILERAQASSAAGPSAVQTYHLRLVTRVPADKNSNSTITAERWFASGGRQRSTEEERDGSGRVLSSHDVLFDGPETWIAATDNGQTRVIHTTGTSWTRPVDDPNASASLADALARYSGGKGCMTAQQRGEDVVAGQPSYVLAVTPSATCGDRFWRGNELTGPAHLSVWVDKRTFLPLRTEVRDAAGTLLERTEATSVEYDVAIPPATFTFNPPPGVPVFTYRGGNGADVKRILAGAPAATPPAKKP